MNGSGTSATLTATSADAGNTITVTGTATDDHNLSTSCTARLACLRWRRLNGVEDWGECTFEKNPKKPWRVDNDCKDVLDKLTLALAADAQRQAGRRRLHRPGRGRQRASTSGAQRAVNVKYYMTTDGPAKVDASRVEPRQGGTKGKATHFYFVPPGA